MQYTTNSQNLFSAAQRRLVKTAFLLVQGTSLTICFMTRLMVYGFAPPGTDDFTVLVQSSALSALLVLLPAVVVALWQRLRAGVRLPVSGVLQSLALAAVCIFCLSACQTNGASVQVKFGDSSTTKGVLMQEGTGLKTTYYNMKPAAVRLVMNDEELGHTDIPLGEKFIVRNEAVEGLVVKNGKVSVGCSLVIVDANGKIMLQETDIFAGNDVYAATEQCVLKCIVSTGAPMEYDKRYRVQVRFWDKYGKGSINNEMTIRSIDMP